MRTRLLLLTVLSWCVFSLFAQRATLTRKNLKIIGTWRLNLAKSIFHTGPVPQTGNLQSWWWEDNTLKHKAELLNEKGEVRNVRGQWSAHFDAKDHLSGGEKRSRVSMTIIDSNHSEMTEGVPGTLLSHFQQVVSGDGRTLTITRNIDGKEGFDILVYDRR